MNHETDIFEIRQAVQDLSTKLDALIKRSGDSQQSDLKDDDDKVAVYSVTKNCYTILIPSIKSLLINSPVDRIYILINEPKFPFEIPKEVIPIDVSDKYLIDMTSPNYNTKYTVMCLMRLAFHRILNNENKVLSLDYDTIVNRDISDMWDVNMGRQYLIGGVPERDRTIAKIHGYFNGDDFIQMGVRKTSKDVYINAAVMMMNLRQLRDEGIGDKALELVNHEFYACPEQDILNELCEGRRYFYDEAYNVSRFTYSPDVQKIVHFAGDDGKDVNHPLIQKYNEIPWNVISEHRKRKYGK